MDEAHQVPPPLLSTLSFYPAPAALICIYLTVSEAQSLFLCLTELYITFPGKLSSPSRHFLPQGLSLLRSDLRAGLCLRSGRDRGRWPERVLESGLGRH